MSVPELGLGIGNIVVISTRVSRYTIPIRLGAWLNRRLLRGRFLIDRSGQTPGRTPTKENHEREGEEEGLHCVGEVFHRQSGVAWLSQSVEISCNVTRHPLLC